MITKLVTSALAVFAFQSFALALTGPELAARTSSKYQTIDVGVAVHFDSARGVKYLTPQEKEQRRVIIQNGVVYSSQNEVVREGVVLDNKSTLQGNEKPEKITYVMDSAGNFYLFDENATPSIRHSSILSAEPVAGAGELMTDDQGHITYVDDNSGHYATSDLFETNVLEALKADGVDLSQVTAAKDFKAKKKLRKLQKAAN